MAAASYYHVDDFPTSDPAAGSSLYTGHQYNNHPVRPSEFLRPALQTINPDINSQNGNSHIKPSRPVIYTAPSNDSGYTNSGFHENFGNESHSYPPPRPGINSNWNVQPSHHSTDPATKPLVHPASPTAPQPLKIQTPNSRLRQRKYQTLKRYLRIGKIITKIITILFSTVMFVIMLYLLIKKQQTNDTIRGARTAWPAQTKLWPTIMMLAGSGLTLLLSLITLLAYCCTSFSEKMRRSWKLTVLKYAVHIGAWLAISTLYRYEKGLHGVDDDLWGWTCSAKAAAIQGEFQGVVNFSSLCSAQVSRTPIYL